MHSFLGPASGKSRTSNVGVCCKASVGVQDCEATWRSCSKNSFSFLSSAKQHPCRKTVGWPSTFEGDSGETCVSRSCTRVLPRGSHARSPETRQGSQLVALQVHRCRCDATIASTSHTQDDGDAQLTYSTLDGEQKEKIDAYLDTLLDWNTRMNLTAVRDRQEAIVRHIDDSLALLPVLDACSRTTEDNTSKSIRVIDIGSGAGLPGLVIATVRPQWKVSLLDSLNKRCTFNTHAAERMALHNVDVIWARAEDAGQDPLYREQFDISIARAVAEMRVLAELCLPFVRVGGSWVAAKGHDPEAELNDASNAILQLGGVLSSIETVESVAPEGKRTAIVVRKKHFCKSRYPRKPGTPKKQPL